MSIATAGTVVAPPPLQGTVDRFVRSLSTSQKLLSLHPRTPGHPGNAAALSPAVVLGTIASFEGFAEDFMAVMMAHQGASFAEIAKKVGQWNNPSLSDFAKALSSYFPAASAGIAVGADLDLWVSSHRAGRYVTRAWKDVLADGDSWMQVRHLLTHGLVTGWRAEWWPGPLRTSDPPAHLVLRPMGGGKHSLVMHGAISCARVYSAGARTVADAVATAYGQTLDWSGLPEFR